MNEKSYLFLIHTFLKWGIYGSLCDEDILKIFKEIDDYYSKLKDNLNPIQL